jgi:23S rRNA pseudouridine2605 synthase
MRESNRNPRPRKTEGAGNNKEEGRRGSGRPADRGDGKKEKKEDGYKSKRSFSKNKSFRDSKPPAKGPRRFERGGREGLFKKRDGDDKFRGAERRNSEERSSDKRGGFRKDEGRENRPSRSEDKGSFRKEGGFKRDSGTGSKPSRFGEAEKPRFRRSESDREERPAFKPKYKSEDSERGSSFAKRENRREPFKKEEGDKKPRFNKRAAKQEDGESQQKRYKYDDFETGKAYSKSPSERTPLKKRGPAPVAKQPKGEGLTRLNKFLANSGISSRREADNLILSGVVKVNGEVVNQLGAKVKSTDKVTYSDAAVKGERKVYILLNKPKDYITTVDDPGQRKTVMELINGACKERVYPVGRLDRNTTGLLLFTNDGELTTRLTHPKFGIKKVYHVTLHKGLKPDDFKAITEGIELEDGIIKADDLAFVGEGKKEIGIEIHSGRNRIVRRLFEHLGYDVIKLDRVLFAGLSKKDLPRGKYRFLTAKEISYLKMLS